jgi:hypothetical protein
MQSYLIMKKNCLTAGQQRASFDDSASCHDYCHIFDVDTLRPTIANDKKQARSTSVFFIDFLSALVD